MVFWGCRVTVLFGGLMALILISGCSVRPIQKGWTLREPLDNSNWDLGPQALGQSWPGIWSSLTDAEIRTLERMDEAKAGHPDALLRLYILASARDREETDMARFQGQVKAFCDSVRPEVESRASKKAKAKWLLAATYRHFIKKGLAPISGYDFDKGALVQLLNERKYNCVSISMLYIVICRHFGIDAKPVIIPGHVFVQIDLAADSVIEVETVTRDGFHVKHDRNFYAAQSSFYSQLYDRQITYTDYQNRKVLQPWEIAVHNMNNQHTMPSLIGVQGYVRLQELQGVLVPGNRGYRSSRVQLYVQAAQKWKADSNFIELARLFQVVGAFVDSARQSGVDSTAAKFLTYLQLYRAEALVRKNPKDNAVVFQIESALSGLPPLQRDTSSLRSVAYALLIPRWRVLIDEKQFPAVESEMRQYAPTKENEDSYRQNLFWLYSSWAVSHWEHQAWGKALVQLKTAYGFAGEQRKDIARNISLAYCNVSTEHLRDRRPEQARKVLQECIQQSPDPKTCEDHLREWKKKGVF